MSDDRRPAARRGPEPLDPDSPRGREVSEHLSEVLGNYAARLIREGKPLPPSLRADHTASTRTKDTDR